MTNVEQSRELVVSWDRFTRKSYPSSLDLAYGLGNDYVNKNNLCQYNIKVLLKIKLTSQNEGLERKIYFLLSDCLII